MRLCRLVGRQRADIAVASRPPLGRLRAVECGRLIEGGTEAMVSRELAERLHRAATSQRWHDHLRPVDLTVQGKQAHMMTIAWVLGRLQEEAKESVDWVYLVEGALAGLLRKCVTFDLKSQVFDRLIQEKAGELNAVVFGELRPEFNGFQDGLFDRLVAYLEKGTPESDSQKLARRVLKAASCLATAWEFKVIEQSNGFLGDIEQVHRNIEEDKRWHQYLPGFLEIDSGQSDLSLFVDLCGRLRFQERWSHTPITPKAKVLDHELMVANLAYLLSLERGYADQRRVNNFFCGLFHDFLEVMTRDIVDPFKRKLAGLEDLVDRYGLEEFQKEVGKILPPTLFTDLEFYVRDEFKPKARPSKGQPGHTLASIDEETAAAFDCCDGDLVKACDRFAAFMEAYYSLDYGTTSRDLRKAVILLYDGKSDFGGGFEEVYDAWFGEIQGRLGDIDEVRDQVKQEGLSA
jgi:putative hydrolase of HD superfamily